MQAQALEKRRSAAERETHARLRVFARFEPSPGAHDELVEGVLLEQRLRSRIQVCGCGGGGQCWGENHYP